MSGKPASEKKADAADAMRAAIVKLEERIDQIGTALLGTEEFAGAAAAASTLKARAQKGLNDHWGRQLAFFNMPSREDIAALGERLMLMDERLARVERLLARIAPPDAETAAVHRPPRTRKPPARAAARPAR